MFSLCSILPLSYLSAPHSLPAGDLSANRKGETSLDTVYSLDATRRASAEEEFNSSQEKEDNSNQEAAFDLGLEEGAEFQDGKLGRSIWPLWTEFFAKF